MNSMTAVLSISLQQVQQCNSCWAPNPVPHAVLLLLRVAVVSDFGNGGQVILDDHTYDAIKEHLTVLGAVEETGIDYRKLASGRSVWARLRALCLDAGWVGSVH